MYFHRMSSSIVSLLVSIGCGGGILQVGRSSLVGQLGPNEKRLNKTERETEAEAEARETPTTQYNTNH